MHLTAMLPWFGGKRGMGQGMCSAPEVLLINGLAFA